MSTKCAQCPLRNLGLFKDFTSEEIQFMERFKVGELQIDPGTPILMQGSKSPQLFTVLRGQGLRHRTLSDGRRQVINFVMPGDFLGLQGTILDEMGHSVEATTPMTLCVFKRDEIWSLFKHHPNRSYDLIWIASTEEHFLGDALATIGQRAAVERIAWAIVRVFQRAQALGLERNNAVRFPYRQQDLADALGLSLVHTNKTLARLRDLQLASWVDGVIRVNKLEELAEIAAIELEALPERPLL